MTPHPHRPPAMPEPLRPGAARAAPGRRTPGGTPGDDGHPEAIANSPKAIIAVRRLFSAQTPNFFLLLGTTLFLVAFGLVMVLSSSAVVAYTESDDPFSVFVRQAVYATIGIPIMLLASRLPSSFWKRWAFTLLVISVALQFLVLFSPLGIGTNGNKNWLLVGGLTFQPSELGKVALAIWLAKVLSTRSSDPRENRRLVIVICAGAGAVIGGVLLGKDLGTASIMAMITLGALYFAGVPLRAIVIPIGVVAALLPVFTFSTNSRGDRIAVWLDQCATIDDQAGLCWQTLHGWWALAAGGFFGVGLGNSKAKWSWLPEADNDFIFAIVGEELGFLGAITLLVLFIVLAISFVRIIRARPDAFARITVSAIGVWIIGQAMVNIGVVLGLLPVLGVPLPLMSSGGTALITTLFALGIALSFAHDRTPAAAPSAAPLLSPVPRPGHPTNKADAARASANRAAAARAAADRGSRSKDAR